jgi:hypothetical protein
MPRVSQNHDGSPKRRLQPIFLLDEPLGGGRVELALATSVWTVPMSASVLSSVSLNMQMHGSSGCMLERTTGTVLLYEFE